MDKDDVSNHIQAMRQSYGFKILLEYWNVEREKIIAEGKVRRSEQKQIQMWSKLDGFDSAVAIIAKLANMKESPESDPELGE